VAARAGEQRARLAAGVVVDLEVGPERHLSILSANASDAS
jgi:hypothetical protein